MLWLKMPKSLVEGLGAMCRVRPPLSLWLRCLPTRCEAMHPLLPLKKGEPPTAKSTDTAGLLTVTGGSGLGPLQL